MQLQGDRRMMESLSKQYPAQDVAMLMSFRSGPGRRIPPAAKYTFDVWSGTGSTVFHGDGGKQVARFQLDFT